jgi:hypothetical protein
MMFSGFQSAAMPLRWRGRRKTMDEPSLFNTARVRINGECSIVDMRDSAPPQPAVPRQLCAYFRGKPLDKTSLCARPGCGRPWSEHYPEYKPQRMRGVIAKMCSICAYPLDSDQHLHHCR